MPKNLDEIRSEEQGPQPDPHLAIRLAELHQQILTQEEEAIRANVDDSGKATHADSEPPSMDDSFDSLAGLLGVLEKMRRRQYSKFSHRATADSASLNSIDAASGISDRPQDRGQISEGHIETPLVTGVDTRVDPGIGPAPNEIVLPGKAGASLGDRFSQVADGGDVATEDVSLDPYHGLRIGRFQIRTFIGQGGFGMVFTAYDDRLDRIVALKVPRPEALLSPNQRQRFLREGRAAAALSHPNIVGALEAGEDGPICYIASEFIDGVNLADWLKVNGPLGEIAIARLVATLAEAVQHAHSRQVLHRDLKPNNVLMSGDKPWLTDFGLAVRLDQLSDVAGSEIVAGTPAFMAPEQANDSLDGLDGRADVYGLGGILYFLLTDRPPFSAASPLETLELVRHRDPPPPRSIRAHVSQDLEAICLKCLEKPATRRYDSAYELHLDLQRFLEGRPVLARPVPGWQRWLRWSRRNPVLGMVGAAALLFLVFGLIASYVGWTSTSRALGDARSANEATLAAQREADQRFLAAKQTVDEYFTQVATNRLLNIPGLTPLRHELLQSALVYYQGFLEQTAGDDELLAEIERAHFRLGEILAELGRPTDSLEHFQHSEQLLIQLMSRAATDPTRQQLHNRTGSRIASQQMVLGHATEAIATLGQAIDRQQELVLAQPANATAIAGLADFLQQKGIALRELRQPEEAHELFMTVVGLREQLLANDDNNEDWRRELLNSQGNLANAKRGLGKLPEAQEISDRVVAGLRELAGRPNSTPADRHTLLKSLYNRSLLSLRVRNFEAASQTLEEAAVIADNLAQVFPAVEAHVRDPAIMRGALAVAYMELGEIENAMENFRLNEQACDQVVEVNPDSTNNLIDAGLAKLNLGAALGNQVKDYSAAREKIAAAQQILGQALDRNPASFNARIGAANCKINLAAFAVELEEWEQAVEHAQRGLDMALALQAEHARNPQLRQTISQGYTNLASGQENLSRYEEAIAAWRNVLEWAFPRPDSLQRLRLAAALILGGQLVEAEEQLGLVEGQLDQRASLWMQQGRCFALYAGALNSLTNADGVERQPAIDEQCHRAITSLERARDLGQFERPVWRAYLENSSELDPLRQLVEFQALLGE